ncbi:MAG: DUF3833 family protein [Sphingomicrobium sp.]
MRHNSVFLAIVTLGACSAAAQPEPKPGGPAFDPVEFFRGRTHGDGQLRVMMQRPKTMRVDSIGRDDPNGDLVLQQIVNEPGKPPRTRFWHLRKTGPDRYTGTLTDAAGPVRIDTVGGKIRIRYKGKDHLDFEQWLTPVGPRRIDNRMKVKRFGIIVAHLDEVITKVD